MIKWNEAVFDSADEDLMGRINREQDDDSAESCEQLFGRERKLAP